MRNAEDVNAHKRVSRPGPLWREAIGNQLRRERMKQGKKLSEVADQSGISQQYLSEVERGLKDPSSEILHAISGALTLSVPRLTRSAADEMQRQHQLGSPQLMAA